MPASPRPSTCSNCDTHTTSLIACHTCNPTESTLYCVSCDRDYHRPQKMRGHQRIPVVHVASGAVVPVGKTEQSKEQQPLCICNGIDDGVRPMIDCNSCDNWFHLSCIGLTDEEADLLYTYRCDNCTLQHHVVSVLTHAMRGMMQMQKQQQQQQQQQQVLTYADTKHMNESTQLIPFSTSSLVTSTDVAYVESQMSHAQGLTHIPAIVVNHMLSFLDSRSLCTSFRVCRSWQTQHDHPSIWEYVTRARWHNINDAAIKAGIPITDLRNCDWKQVYQQYDKLRTVHALRRSNAHMIARVTQHDEMHQQLSRVHAPIST